MQIRPSEGMKEVEIAWLNGSKERKLLLLSFLKNAMLLDSWPWSIHKKHDIDRFLSTFQILQDFKTKEVKMGRGKQLWAFHLLGSGSPKKDGEPIYQGCISGMWCNITYAKNENNPIFHTTVND